MVNAAESPSKVTSGVIKLAVGFCGTGMPPTETTRTVGTFSGRNGAPGVTSRGLGLKLPVNWCWKASKRMRPYEPLPLPWALSVPVPLMIGAMRRMAPPLPPPPFGL